MNPFETQVGGDHYRSMKIQPAEFIHANGIPFLEGCVIKYVCRHRQKNGAQDIRKAIHFLELLIKLEYGADRQTEPTTKTTHEKLEAVTGQKLDLKMCLDQNPGQPFCLCTRPVGHAGSHVAGNPHQPNIAVWDSQCVVGKAGPLDPWICPDCNMPNPHYSTRCQVIGCKAVRPA